MSVEHVLMFALIVFVFYHFMCGCNRVEGVSATCVKWDSVMKTYLPVPCNGY